MKGENVGDSFESSIENKLLWKSDYIRRWYPRTKSRNQVAFKQLIFTTNRDSSSVIVSPGERQRCLAPRVPHICWWVKGKPHAAPWEKMERDEDQYTYGVVFEYNMHPIV
jgi:hypothetical protein